MHDVERLTWIWLSRLLSEVDPDKTGWAIDAGLGRSEFYCEWTQNMGYKSIGIEPVPTDEAARACASSNVPLISAALGDKDGEAMLFNAPERDLRSLDGELWGGMHEMDLVPVVTLASLLEEYHIDKVTLLKMDIEGTEPEVINTLPDLDEKLQPSLICFEFGGAGPLWGKSGPWQSDHHQILLYAIRILNSIGYNWGVVIGSGDGLFAREFSGIPRFSDTDNWGNIIMAKDKPSGELIEELRCQLPF